MKEEPRELPWGLDPNYHREGGHYFWRWTRPMYCAICGTKDAKETCREKP